MVRPMKYLRKPGPERRDSPFRSQRPGMEWAGVEQHPQATGDRSPMGISLRPVGLEDEQGLDVPSVLC